MKKERFDGIISLNGPDRYRHFVKSVVDRGEAWGLYDDGWALSGVDAGTEALPLWPEQEFAEACSDGNWSGYAARPIPLSELMEVVLPELLDDEDAVAVFPTPDDKGVVPPIGELLADLKEEQLEYA
jgi:hypothetical protein